MPSFQSGKHLKGIPTFITDVDQHGHQNVVGQVEAIAVREDGIPEQQKVQ